MISNTIEDKIFTSELKINYDKRFITIAQAFIEKNLELAGVNKKEIYQTSMIVEESLVFIIDKYIDNGFDAFIEIILKLNTNSIEVSLTNIGPPIHPEKIPDFNIADNLSVDGLWYQMVKNMTTSFEFVNNYNKGWLINFSKNLPEVNFLRNENCMIKNTSPETPKSLGKITTRYAVPEDASELIDLAFMTYRYSNGIPEFYDKEVLSKYIAGKLYDIIVTVMDGKIIGALNIKYSEFDLKSAEMGSAMVNPAFRNSKALLHLIREANKYHIENSRNLDIFVTYLVTTHTLSQRAVAKVHNGYKPFSISLGMIPRPDYIDIKDKMYSRESLLNAFHLNDKLKVDELYVSKPNKEIINEIIENSGNSILLKTEEVDPQNNITDLFHFTIESINSSILIINEIGKDWFNELRKKVFFLIANGSKTIIVSITGNTPLPVNFNERMADLNLIFCGLNIKSISEIQLSYVLTTEPVDFGIIELASPTAKNLLNHIENRYKDVFGIIDCKIN